eukprot:10531742-Alexandrium_andersonii.AAC.1
MSRLAELFSVSMEAAEVEPGRSMARAGGLPRGSLRENAPPPLGLSLAVLSAGCRWLCCHPPPLLWRVKK